MNVNDIGEFGLISRLTSRMMSEDSKIVRGVGDDTAAFHQEGGRLLLATTDAQIEGIHFTRDGFSPEQIGRRAAAVNLSDIAAMGGRPLFALVSLATPASMPVEFLERVYVGLNQEFQRFGATIIGGNTAELPERLLLDVALLGEIEENQLLRRDMACSGNLLCVTGVLGKSAAGLILKTEPHLIEDEELRQRALESHRVPTPRVAEGMLLGRSGCVTSCIDVSDGVLGDAHHIARQSNVTVHIEMDRLPVAEEARAVAAKIGKDSGLFALTGGEDFELMFTLAPESVSGVFSELWEAAGCLATVIGRIEPGGPGVRLTECGRDRVFSGSGFRHF